MKAVRWLVWLLPARGGLHKTTLGNICNSCQADSVLWKTVWATVRIKHRTQRVRSSLGICRSTGTYLEWMSSSDGRGAVLA